jgi:hypothetical protein
MNGYIDDRQHSPADLRILTEEEVDAVNGGLLGVLVALIGGLIAGTGAFAGLWELVRAFGGR